MSVDRSFVMVGQSVTLVALLSRAVVLVMLLSSVDTVIPVSSVALVGHVAQLVTLIV